MATYKGRLEEGRRFKGVQVTLYKPDGAKIDATTSDKDGFYSFTSLKTGIYHVRFEGRDYDPAKYQIIFVAEDGSNIIYYIRANDGTTIKNSTGTLSLDLIELKNGEYTDVTEGNVKLYYKTGASSYALLSSLAGVTASDYTAVIEPSAFSDKLEVVAIKDFGTADEFVIDGITLLNLSDGAQGPGILYIGEWADIAGNRELNNNGLAIDVVSLSGTYYAWRGADVTVKSGASFPTTGLPDWEEFQSFSAIATGLLIAEKSYIKETVTVGTNAEGTAANIVIWGGDTNPYISIGQAAGYIGYNELGIWAGMATGVAKLSMKSASGSLLWDGTNLDVTGRIFAQAGGTIAGWDIGADSISKNGVYLSSVVGEGGLYINDTGIKRLQIGDFSAVPVIETNVWQGTISSENENVAGVISVGTSGGVSESTSITFTYISGTSGYSEGYAILNLPNIVLGGTITISFDLENPTYLPPYISGLWPTYKPQMIVQGSYNSGANLISELYLLQTPSDSNYYPTTTKHLLSFNNPGATLQNVQLKFSAKGKFTSSGVNFWYVKNLKIYNSVPKASFTKDQVLLYVSPQNYFEWTKSAVTLKGGNLDVGNITAGSATISGDLTVQGQAIISGELSSHPTISAATSVNNSNGYVIQDLTFDAFGHVTGTVSTDLDSRFVKLTEASQSITGNLTITGDVTISGGLTTVNTTTVTTSDNLIIINNGEVGAGVTGGTAGIQVDRGSLTDYQFMFRESDDSFVIGEIGSLQKVATRQDTPISMGAVYWNNSTFNFDTSANFLWDETNKRLSLSNGGGNYVGIRFLRTGTGQHDAEIALVDDQLSFNHDPNTGTYITHAYITSTGFHLGSAASIGTHAVRADRTISLTGTANQVTVTGTTAQALTGNPAWTLSLPQNIHTAATPTFDALTLTGSTNSTILLSGPSQMGGITIRNNFTVSGGWARGFILQDTSAAVVFGAGYYGSDQVVNGYYIGTGASWWSNYGLRVDSSRNVYLGNAGTATTHAVRADRAIILNIGNSLTRTGNASQNLTSDPTYTFDTIQDIRTTASPTFAGLTTTAAVSLATGVSAGQTGLNLNNTNLVGVNNIQINDPGVGEGIEWVGGNLWKIFESPDNLTSNTSGNLQIAQGTTRRATFNTSGQLDIPIASGTAPLVIASTSLVGNLNADLWDGYQFADYLNQDVKNTASPTFAGLTVDNLKLDGNIISATSGNIVMAPVASGQVQILTNGQTIAGTTYANGWLVIGASNGIAFDDNEIVKFGGALNFATNANHDIIFATNKTTRFAFKSDGNSDFYGNTLVNVGIANIDEARIGDTAIVTWEATSPFVDATAPFNITTAVGTAPYQRLLVMRNNNNFSAIGLRRLGMSFHFSSEASTVESNKMGAITVESSSAYTNYPELKLWTANKPRLVVDSFGQVFIDNLGSGSYDTLTLSRNAGQASIKGKTTGGSDANGALVIDGSSDSNGHVYINNYVGRNFYINSGTTKGSVYLRTTGADGDISDIRMASQVTIENESNKRPFLNLRSDGSDTYAPEIYFYEGQRSATTDSGFVIKYLGSTNRTDFIARLNGVETRTYISFIGDASRIGILQTPDAVWNVAITGDLIANGKLSLVGQNSISFGGSVGNLATNTLPGWYANDTTWVRNLNNKGLYLSGTTGNDGALLIENFTGSSAYASSYFGVGWKIFKNSLNEWSAEFDNLLIRNVLRAHIFQKDIVRATNGFLYIADASELSEDVDLTAILDGATITIYVKEQVFQSGDLLWYKDINDSTGLVITGVKLVITDAGTGVTRNSKSVISYTATLSSGAGSVMKTGGTIVRVGGSAAGRGGSIFMDASTSSAPFIDIYNDVTTWTDFQSLTKLKARLGNISGVTSPVFGALQGYGLYTNNIYLEGNAAIAGTLTAGDINGFGSTFYVGALHKNRVTNSENLNTWSASNSSTALETIELSPVIGSKTWKVLDNVTNGVHGFNAIPVGIGNVNGTWYTLSFYSKIVSGSSFNTLVIASDLNGSISYNLSTGAVGPDVTRMKTVHHTALSGGWYKTAVRYQFNTGDGGITFRLNVNGAYIGNGSSGVYLSAPQIEAGQTSNAYQPTDGFVVSSTGYGMWSTAGGFGGTMQAPVVSLNNYGLRVESGRGTQTTQIANSILIGNIVAHGTLASNAGGIRITNTGTTSTSGIFGHDAAGNPAFQLKLDGTAQIASFFFDDGDLWAGDSAIGNTNTKVVISSVAQKIALGASANSISTTNNTAGFYVDSLGKFKISDGTNYIIKDSGVLSLALSTFTLTATNLVITSGAANTANITIGTGDTAAGLNSPAGGSDIAFWAGSTFANRASAVFNVTAAGALTASSATITGVITANTGFIGGASGWVIATNTLSSTGITLTHNAVAAGASIRLGASSALGTGNGIWMDGAGNFRVGDPTGSKLEWSSSILQVTGVVNINGDSTFTGSISVNSGGLTMNGGTITAGSTTLSSSGIVANQGSVGGWTLASGSLTGGSAVLANTGVLTLGTGNDVAIVSASDATYRFWAGHATAASAPFSVTKGGAMYASNATMEQVTYSKLLATGLLTINSGNASSFYTTFTATGGTTKSYTLLDLSTLSTTTSFVRIEHAPTYPIAAIRLPTGVTTSYTASLIIEVATSGVKFLAWVGLSGAPMDKGDSPAITDYERIAVDAANWAYNLFASDTSFNITDAVGCFTATSGTRYDFNRSKNDWKLQSANTLDIITLQKAYIADELHVTDLYATNVIASSVSGTVYFNQILTSLGTISSNEKSKAVVTSTTGVLEVLTTVSSTEVGYLAGVTSAIQTQINTKAAHTTTLTFSTNNGLTGGAVALDLSANRAWTFGLTGQALNLHNNTAAGLFVRTAAGAITSRSLAVSGTGLSISNAAGDAGNPTISSNATNLNTASAIVARDASGNFSAGTITATLTGNASTATTLATTRSIAISGPITGTATNFNGSANITIPVTALDVGHANITGVLAADHGGTGLATIGANQVMYGNGTSAVQTSANLTFNGSLLSINGTLEATEKSFNIAHPTQPGKRLIYGVLEGPEHAVYCRGTVKGNEITLPEEWAGLVHENTITVQLTARGKSQKLYVKEVKGGKVYIANGNMIDKFIHADYLIMGTRKDVAKLKTVREAVQ